MNNLRLLLAAVVLLAFTQIALAQHGGHGGMGGMGGSGHDAHAGGMPDMRKMMAMQASDEQAGHYREWMTATGTARLQVRELQHAPDSAVRAAYKDGLHKTIAKAHESQQLFVNSLTGEQQSGLKKQVQRVDKARAEVDKQLRMFDQEISGGDQKRIMREGQKLEKALANWKKGQREIASQMGLQG